MSDEQNQPNAGAEEVSAESQKPDELQMLKSRARMMGITFSNNIGVDALRDKIEQAGYDPGLVETVRGYGYRFKL